MGFTRILQSDFNKLHPKLQDRYKDAFTKPYEASGTMHVMQTQPKILKPMYKKLAKNNFIIPESGENIPFHLRTTPLTVDEDNIAIKWERTFFFPEVTRSFHTTLHFSLKDQSVIDYLGSPTIASAQMHYYVTKAGHLVHLSGQQQAILGPFRISLPPFLSGHGAVIDGYDDKRQVHTVKAFIANDIIGNIMIYSGEFQEDLHIQT